ncbi:Uncharacterized protein TCM_038802 [Theobroma cacao]|uniref:Uncharacterized protein n=1 Tax=Theobroma cacao TaxID=3641 RepID=A0A061GQE4_THECC|nr:Uncharacterized protein TCM_038802 [Theobroma cacao]
MLTDKGHGRHDRGVSLARVETPTGGHVEDQALEVEIGHPVEEEMRTTETRAARDKSKRAKFKSHRDSKDVTRGMVGLLDSRVQGKIISPLCCALLIIKGIKVSAEKSLRKARGARGKGLVTPFKVDHMDLELKLSPNYANVDSHLKKLRIRDGDIPKTTFHMSFLGHIVSKNGMMVDLKKNEAMEKWPRLTSVTEIWSFLGLARYYKRFVKKSMGSLSHILVERRSLVQGMHELSDIGIRFEVDDTKALILMEGKDKCSLEALVDYLDKDLECKVSDNNDLGWEILKKAYVATNVVLPGTTKMYHDLIEWEGLKRNVVEFVAKCLVFQQVKVEHQKPTRFL